MAHSSNLLASFQSGETRLIYARRLDDGTLFLLPDGEADAHRQFTREQLRCLVPDCPEPKLKVMGRARKRDGFSHFGGAGGHAPEGTFHIQGCEMIAVWLRDHYPRSVVRKEEASNRKVERRADVMITAADSSRVAFEIQYAALNPTKWQARHNSYAAQGIPDVWLFGHYGTHLKSSRNGENHVALSATHEAVAATGLPLLWVNPITRQIATVVTTAVAGGHTFEIPATKGSGQFVVDNLDDYHLTRNGLTSNRLLLLAVSLKAYEEAEAKDAREEAERVSAAERQAAAKAIRDARAAEALARRTAHVAAAAAALEPAWRASKLRATILSRHRGVWPSFLDIPVKARPGIPLPRQQWQAQLWTDFIDGRPIGARVESMRCAEALGVPVGSRNETVAAIRMWLEALAVEGRIYITRKRKRFGSTYTYSVMPFSRESAVAVLQQLPVKQILAERPHLGEQVVPEYVEPSRQPEPYAIRQAARAEAMAAIAGNPACRYCRLPLFDSQVGQGHHDVCAQGWTAR